VSPEKFYRTSSLGLTLILVAVLAWWGRSQEQLTDTVLELQASIAKLQRQEIAAKTGTAPHHTATDSVSDVPPTRAILKDEAVSFPPPDDAPFFPTIYIPDGSFIDDPFVGKKGAEIIIMAFSSYDCRTCRKFFKESFPKLKSEFVESGKARFIFRDLPVSSQPQGNAAALAANCAGEQGGYWKINELLYNNPKDVGRGDFAKVFSSLKNLDQKRYLRCLENTRSAREIQADIDEALRLGAKGSPGFFIGKRETDQKYRGVFIRGAQPYELFKLQLQRLLS